MGYEFHTVRRTVPLALKVSELEFAMVKSAQLRRGFQHVTHYLRELLWEDGATMGDPKLVAAAIKERWPQQSLDFNPVKVSAVPRDWDAELNRLSSMVRAAMVLAPEAVPEWALQFGEPIVDQGPASESKSKKNARVVKKRRKAA